MNRAILLGRLTKDPEARYTDAGEAIARFTLAVNRPKARDGKDEADFIPVVAWGKNAELLAASVTKGQRLLVEGRIRVRSYDDKDGARRYVTEISLDRFEYIEAKGGAQSSAPFTGPGYQAVPFAEQLPF